MLHFRFAHVTVFCLFALLSLSREAISACREGEQREASTSISKQELASTLQKGEAVRLRRVTGADLIQLLNTLAIEKVELDCSIIEGGLDFSILPLTSAETVKFPADWRDEDKQRWLARTRGVNKGKVYVVTPALDIQDTEIKKIPQDKSGSAYAVEATATFFRRPVTFRSTTFSGGAAFRSHCCKGH